MPHIILETTADLPENGAIPDILEALVTRLSRFDSVMTESVKAYHTLRSVWAVGDGHPPGFAHCTVKILEGRSEATRIEIADAMYAELKDRFSQSLEIGEVGLTLEVHEMTRATYRK